MNATFRKHFALRAYCGKIGFLPNGLRPVGIKVNSTNFTGRRKSLMSSPLSKLILKIRQQDDTSYWRVCHWRFHGILPKEYSGTFYQPPCGLYEEMRTNTQGQSDIVSCQTNIWNKISANWLLTTISKFIPWQQLGNCDNFYFTTEFEYRMGVRIVQILESDQITIYWTSWIWILINQKIFE